ncbi:MAG: hypothetical protein IH609_05370, partial [Dehalococcoidia bacterium]|nr:hypothetical protein [Dehalococcoidia bacterium]
MRETSDDPIAAAALDALNDLLERNQRVGRVLLAAVRSLEEPAQPGTAPACDQPAANENSLAATPELQESELSVVRAFQQRLGEVYGVASVTFAGSAPDGYRFLVTMTQSGAL